MIELEGVSHDYGPLPVLRDLGLRVAGGEIVALLGPSGCGKSTLLRLVGGLEKPTFGSIRVPPGGVAVSGGAITYVFQDPTLLPWRTAAGNVALPLEHLGLASGDRHRRVVEALARVSLTEFAEAYPGSLSGGMKQRVSIARALVVRPAVLLMDEPLGSLDELSRDLLIADLVRIWSETPYTCLYVTHDPFEAVRIAHRVVVLSQRPGRIREIIPIDVPIDKRSRTHPTIVEARERIWKLVRNPE
jgi:NitT/TauT family transport system ATP-binding protein